MEIDLNEARLALKKNGKITLMPSLEPDYVMVDSTRNKTLIPSFFLYENQDGFYYHAFHKGKIQDTDFYDIQSPYNYGGPVVLTENSNFLSEAWEAYLKFCRNNNILVEFIRFHPLLENWKHYKSDVIYDRETVWIELTNDDLLASYEIRARTAIRKAVKNNVEVVFLKKEDFIFDFKKIYHETMKRINAADFYFFNDDYFEAMCSWPNSQLVAAYQENKIVSAAIFLMNDKFLEYHLAASTDEGRKLSAINLILHEMFLRAKANGCNKAYLGGGASNQADDPLLFFKSGFSIHRAKYYIGKHVHNMEQYDALKRLWQTKNGSQSNRILFYRNKW